MFEIKGSVKVLNETNVISDKFKKREFVLTDDNSEYPQDIQFQLTQDNCSKLDNVSVGDRLTVKFNLRGRAWNDPKTGNDRYFNSLDCWAIQKEGNTPAPQPIAMNEDEASDLPF